MIHIKVICALSTNYFEMVFGYIKFYNEDC